jgi:hypothetical protein
MTVTVIFADADDAYVWQNGVNWTTVKTATTGLTDTSNPVYSGLEGSAGSYFPEQGFVRFDGSGLPDTDTVSDAVLSLVGDPASTPASDTLEARDNDYASPVADTHYATAVELAAMALLASIASGSWNTGARNSLTSQAGHAAAISKTGFNGYILVSARIVADSDPLGAAATFTWVRAEAGGTTNDAALTVTHAAGGAAQTPYRQDRQFVAYRWG